MTVQTNLEKAQQEASIEPYVQLSSVVAPGVVMCRSGEMIATWKVAGIPFETADNDSIAFASEQINTLLRALNRPEMAIQIHRVRRHIKDSLSSTHQGLFLDYLTSNYNLAIGEHALMATELYVTLIMRKASMLNAMASSRVRSFDEVKMELRERLNTFGNICDQLERSLGSYGLVRLGEYHVKDKVFCSEQLSFYNFLLTGVWQAVRIPDRPLHQILGNAHVFVGNDILQLQTPTDSRYAQIIELKDYASVTASGIFDNLLYPDTASVRPYEFIESQTFCFMATVDAKSTLKAQQKQLMASADDSVSQIAAINIALDGITNGSFGLGQYSYTLTIFGEDEKTCRANTRDAFTKLTATGFVPFVSTLAAAASFFSMSPCNFKLRPRIANLTTVNFAHMAPLHSFYPGKRNGNPWGEAVCLLLTPSDQPYYFNFHTSPYGKNSYGDKTLANTLILGMSGAGKTVLANFLVACAQKYRTEHDRLSCIFFDKDRGAEIAIRAMGGGYLTLENGKPTGFNPFMLEDTPTNIAFLERLVKMLVGHAENPLTAQEELRLSNAIRNVLKMPPQLRRLEALQSFIVEGKDLGSENSLPKRLQRWFGDGPLAWVFDNPTDELDFNRFDIFGIDGSEFLDNREICSPVTYYLLYRMESIIDGRRFFFVMDEFWKYLQDKEVGEYVKNKVKTIRKQNGFAVFATQEPSDVIESPIASSLIQQCNTMIFLPNTKARAEDYTKHFRVTEAEFAIISRLSPDSRAMLIKQGGSSGGLNARESQSAMCKLNLGFMPDVLPILSGSTDNVAILDEIRAKYGDNPDDWLTPFLDAVKARNA